MRSNPVIEKWRDGEKTIGAWLSSDSSYVAENEFAEINKIQAKSSVLRKLALFILSAFLCDH